MDSLKDKPSTILVRGKKVAILGFGAEGESAARFLLNKGAEVSVFDAREEANLEQEKIEGLRKRGVSFHFNSYPETFSSFDFIIRSPGIRLSSSVIEKVREQGVPLTSLIKLFFDFCPARIIGVTGTKGKGTTSSLIYEMLKKQGSDAYLGGNIGIPPLDFLDKLTESSWVVLELSSFQLQDLEKSPNIAVVLMITSEHLDYHKDVREYVDAKRNILRFQGPQDIAILNRDYSATNESDTLTLGKLYFVSREREVKEGCFVEDGWIVIRTDSSSDKRIIPIKDILLPGKHNLENVCPASMAAYLAGVDVKNIAQVLQEFKGLEHRLELVRIFNGVKYYDDSFSTTPETAIAAIEAFEAPMVLILGGSSKNSDFEKLGRTIREAKNIKAIIGIGDEWQRIRATIDTSTSLGASISQLTFDIVEDCFNMREIVQKASKIAKIGDVVILSPACASFDMFKNYKERGEQFKKEVEGLI